MKQFWICDDCSSENPYPDVRECETCGMPITEAAEKRVLQDIKDEEKRQEEIRKEQERIRKEKLRAEREAARKREQERQAKLRAEEERKRIARIEEIMKRKERRERKLSSYFRTFSKIADRTFKIASIAAICFVIAIMYNNSGSINFENWKQQISHKFETEYIAHTVVIPEEEPTEEETVQKTGENVPTEDNPAVNKEERMPRTLYKITEVLSTTTTHTVDKIGGRLTNLSSTFHPIENTGNLITDIVEFVWR